MTESRALRSPFAGVDLAAFAPSTRRAGAIVLAHVHAGGPPAYRDGSAGYLYDIGGGVYVDLHQTALAVFADPEGPIDTSHSPFTAEGDALTARGAGFEIMVFPVRSAAKRMREAGDPGFAAALERAAADGALGILAMDREGNAAVFNLKPEIANAPGGSA